VVSGTAHLAPVAVLAAVTIATVPLTELITNNGAAVLLFPSPCRSPRSWS
jgi:hypothetical protein